MWKGLAMGLQLFLDIETEIDHSPIYYVLVQCPVKKCRSTECPVVHTEGRIRFHKCVCGHSFKSIEAPLKKPDASPDAPTGE